MEVTTKSYGKLNIWIRYSDCGLVTDCWMTDLVIKTCGGDYLVDMDPTVIDGMEWQKSFAAGWKRVSHFINSHILIQSKMRWRLYQISRIARVLTLHWTGAADLATITS